MSSELHSAITSGDTSRVTDLIRSGANVNSKDFDGRTPLAYAVIDSQFEILEILLRSGADPNIQDNDGLTPLHFAAKMHLPDSVKQLVRHGAKIDAKDAFGNTPLWRAVFESRGRSDVVKLLVSLGANPDNPNYNKVSPRALASKIANYDLSGLFLP